MELTYILIAALIVILPIILTKMLSAGSRDAKKVLGAEAPSLPAATPGAAVPVPQEAKRPLAQGRKMQRFKSVPVKTGSALEAAKDTVDTIVTKKGPVLRSAGLTATIRHAQEVSEEVQRLVAKGQKIEAIKLLREKSGLGLREAKDLVDRLG
jgi:ribosomal protein L7/L12